MFWPGWQHDVAVFVLVYVGMGLLYETILKLRRPDPMPNRSRQKGDRFERECVTNLRELGVWAERVPLSGAAGGTFTDDLYVEVCGQREQIECKTRARAWGDLVGWLKAEKHAKPPYCLFIKADRTPTMVVMSLETFAKLSKGIL